GGRFRPPQRRDAAREGGRCLGHAGFGAVGSVSCGNTSSGRGAVGVFAVLALYSPTISTSPSPPRRLMESSAAWQAAGGVTARRSPTSRSSGTTPAELSSWPEYSARL